MSLTFTNFKENYVKNLYKYVRIKSIKFKSKQKSKSNRISEILEWRMGNIHTN